MANSVNKRFETTVTHHFDALYRFAYRLTGEQADAEDLVQDTCVKAYMNLADLERFEHPRAWLLRVQYRTFLDENRRRKRSPLQPWDDTIESSLSMASPIPGPEDHVDAAALGRRLERAWTQLETAQQALLALHAEGYNLPELQEITGVPRNALKARLQRARTRLARLLKIHTPRIAISSGVGK